MLLPITLTGAVSAPTDSDAAQRAYAAGDYETARQLWVGPAEAGDAAAQLGLASLYDLGKGVARDPAIAFSWYRRAAMTGSAAAEFNVAVMRDNGDGVTRDAAEAALWYGRAAAHGNRRAQYNLGQLYAAGDGVPRNLDQAETWFRAAAAEVPAAAGKLVAMRRAAAASRADRPTRADKDARPVPARLVAPADGDVAPALVNAASDAMTVELVWVGPAQPVPTRFFVQLLTLDTAEPREVFATYLDETAILASLDRVPGRYAWRVYAVGRSLEHYTASEWSQFQVRLPR